MSLTWKRGSQWHLHTDDGRYSVSKAAVLGVYRYQAWRCDRQPATLLGTFDSADEAKHCAYTDALQFARRDVVAERLAVL